MFQGPCYEKDTNTPVCANNATCRIVNSGYFCECSSGYAGQNCSKPLKSKHDSNCIVDFFEKNCLIYFQDHFAKNIQLHVVKESVNNH